VIQHQIAQSLPSIALAVIAAFGFAGAAVLQHRAVSERASGPSRSSAAAESGAGPLSLRGLREITRRPGWLLGLLLAAGGSFLHAIALILAPLSVVQPVGVLAVPIAVVLTAARTHRRPTTGMLVGVVVCVTAVVTFVGTAAGSAASTPAPGRATLLAGVVVGLVVLVLAGIGLARTGWARCVACAMAGAAAFGLVSALVRAVSQAVASGEIGILDPAVVTTVAGVATAILTGGWLIQQAFAAGPPEVVVACLTVVDPIVAVLFGVLLLGEGNATSPGHWAVLITAALAATAGVGTLARHHPEATTRMAERAPRRAAYVPRSHRR
jgi:drug/metabolite transporter (DMT)-like permease